MSPAAVACWSLGVASQTFVINVTMPLARVSPSVTGSISLSVLRRHRHPDFLLNLIDHVIQSILRAVVVVEVGRQFAGVFLHDDSSALAIEALELQERNDIAFDVRV